MCGSPPPCFPSTAATKSATMMTVRTRESYMSVFTACLLSLGSLELDVLKHLGGLAVELRRAVGVAAGCCDVALREDDTRQAAPLLGLVQRIRRGLERVLGRVELAEREPRLPEGVVGVAHLRQPLRVVGEARHGSFGVADGVGRIALREVDLRDGDLCDGREVVLAGVDEAFVGVLEMRERGVEVLQLEVDAAEVVEDLRELERLVGLDELVARTLGVPAGEDVAALALGDQRRLEQRVPERPRVVHLLAELDRELDVRLREVDVLQALEAERAPAQDLDT